MAKYIYSQYKTQKIGDFRYFSEILKLNDCIPHSARHSNDLKLLHVLARSRLSISSLYLLLRFYCCVFMRFLFIITFLLLRLVENSRRFIQLSSRNVFSPSKRTRIFSGYRVQLHNFNRVIFRY